MKLNRALEMRLNRPCCSIDRKTLNDEDVVGGYPYGKDKYVSAMSRVIFMLPTLLFFRVRQKESGK